MSSLSKSARAASSTHNTIGGITMRYQDFMRQEELAGKLPAMVHSVANLNKVEFGICFPDGTVVSIRRE